MSDWNHFFASLRKYLDYFRAHIQTLPELNGFANGIQTISNSELAGLLSWTNFVTTISLKSSELRRQIYEERNWNCIESITGLLASPIPLVLKGAFYKFLAALAIDEVAAVNVWNSLLCEGICTRQPDGKLKGIQQDLDERESQLKIYDCTQGFLTLMKELLTHKTRPGVHQTAPYLQYIVDSVLCRFPTRSYNSSKQMWLLVKLAIDSLCEPLKTFYATPATVENKVMEVQILSQLLTDSPLSRTLLQIIAEGANRLRDDTYTYCPSRENATASAIRLLFVAISHRAALADAVRTVNSNIMVVSLESILFSPIPQPQQKQRTNYLMLLLQYIHEADQMIEHTFYVWKILKEATAQRPSLQPRIIQALLPRRAQLIASSAAMSIFSAEDISVTINDLPATHTDFLTHDRLKGEVCRLMFEVFNESMELDADSPNIAYALMNFDLCDLQSTMLEIPSPTTDGLTCLNNLLEIALQLVESEDPFSAPFSGLYEPALRLTLRLCSVKAASHSVMLRFIRSQYDLIYRLANSRVFRQYDFLQQVMDSEYRQEESIATTSASMATRRMNDADESPLMTIHKSIQAIILELIALEMSSLIKAGHIEQPRRFLAILLSPINTTNQLQNSSQNGTDDELNEQAYLWVLLDASRVYVEEIGFPQCNKFDSQKIEELLSLCIRKNSCNIDQFDVVYLHLLLNSEINCIMNTEIGIIREEARAILEYCVRKNARNLLEGACAHLLEGWLSLMNVLSFHAPLPFLDIKTHQHLLVDTLFLLRDYSSSVEMTSDLAASVAGCIGRIVRAICSLFHKYEQSQTARESLLPILYVLLQCIVLPGYSKSVAFKLELYGSCLRAIDLFNSLKTRINEEQSRPAMMNGTASARMGHQGQDPLNQMLFAKVGQQTRREHQHHSMSIGNADPMVSLVRHERIITDIWMQLIEPLTQQLVQTLTSDIVFAPLMLKMLATATFVDIIREDSRLGGRMAKEFIISGSLQCVDDSLNRLQQSLTSGQMVGEENRRHAVALVDALKSLTTLSRSSMRTLAVS